MAAELGIANPGFLASLTPPAAAAGSGVQWIEGSAVAVDDDIEDPETFLLEINDAVNGYIVVYLSWYNGTISSVTFDGTTMASISSGASGSDSNVKGAMYGLAIGNKAAGTYTISIDPSSSGLEMAMYADHFDGVHQTTSTGTAAIQTAGTSSPGTVTVSSAANEIVTSFMAYYEQDATKDSGQTQTAESETNPGTSMWINVSREQGAASTTSSYTYSGTQSRVTIGVGLKPAP